MSAEGLRPIDIIRTVKETSVDRGLDPQVHQVWALAKSLLNETESREWGSGYNPVRDGFFLEDNQRVFIAEDERGLKIDVRHTPAITASIIISTAPDERGGRRFRSEALYSTSAGDTVAVISDTAATFQRTHIARAMLSAGQQILKLDLTTRQPLWKSPKERGATED